MKKTLLARMFNLARMCAEVQPYPQGDKGGRRRLHGACQVCGDQAAGTYFGAKVCIPCKAFFIRSTSENTSVFECPGDQRCNINVHTRTACKYCRFQKCLKAGMTRREKSSDDKEGLLVCAICGDEANGVHFGAMTCEGCKKFYRRGMLIGEAKTYVCKSNKTCEITPRTRNNCRYCRFQKCIQKGMSRDAIQMGRPSRYQRPKVLKNEMQLDVKDEPASTDTSQDSMSCNSFPSHFAQDSGQAYHDVNLMSDAQNMPSTHNQATFATMDGDNIDVPQSSLAIESQSSSRPSMLYASLLGESLQVCHTDMSSLGIGQNVEKTGEQSPNATTVANTNKPSEEGKELTLLTNVVVTPSVQANMIPTGNSAAFQGQQGGYSSTGSSSNSQDSLYGQGQVGVSNAYQLMLTETMESTHHGPKELPYRNAFMQENVQSGVNSPQGNGSASKVSFLMNLGGATKSPTFTIEEVCRQSSEVKDGHNDTVTLTTKDFPPSWPTRLSPTSEEVDRMFRSDYWSMSQNSCDLILTEEHQALIDHLVVYSRDALTQTEKANTLLKEDMEGVWRSTKDYTTTPTAHIKRGIARYIKAAMVFFMNIPGFNTFDKTDQLFLVRNCSPQLRILMAGINWYNPETEKFSHDFYDNTPPPNRIDYLLFRHVVDLSKKVSPLEIDSIEEALLETLLLIAADYRELKSPKLIEDVRQHYLAVLVAYTTAKYGSNNTRIDDLFSVIPALRIIGMEHAFMSRGIVLGPDESYLLADLQRSKGNKSPETPHEEDPREAGNAVDPDPNDRASQGIDMAACL